MTNTASPASLLVPFGGRHRGPRGVLLHPEGGGLGPYLGVASLLDRHGPVHGIRAAGLLPGETPDVDVSAMVDRYHALIRDTADLGGLPDVLFGWSLGGVLAWELAVRMAAGGHRPRVVMVDSPALPREVGPDVRRRVLAGLGAIGPHGDLAVRTAKAHLDAVSRSTVRVAYDGPALLLSCMDEAGDVAVWRGLGARLRTAELPGGHFDVFTPRVLPVLSAAVTRFLADTEPDFELEEQT
jgi:thioesterase domain-containing protein